MPVSSTQVKEMYARFMAFIDNDERSLMLKVMYEDFQDELISAPASGKVHFHNCFPGGYIDHVLRVTDTTLRLCKMYNEMQGKLNFTMQEAVFAAIHHDFGKLGSKDGPYYVDQDSQWHREKQGEMYKHNHDIGFMKVPDRALFLLQQYGIKITENEFYGIKLSDGLYDDSNKAYLINYTHKYPIRTNLPAIIHTADYLATQVESDAVRG